MNTCTTPDPRATNAARHGILANTPVVPGMETEADWQRHRDGILASLAPQDHLQAVLAERIALQLWRLARVARYEADVTTREREYAQRDAPTSYDPGASRPQKVRHTLLRLALPQETELEKIQRYEAHLSRELYRALKEYKSLQALPTPICNLQSAMPNSQSHSQNCETNPTATQTQPAPEAEPTPSRKGRVQGVNHPQTHQPTPPPVPNVTSPAARNQKLRNKPTPAKRRR